MTHRGRDAAARVGTSSISACVTLCVYGSQETKVREEKVIEYLKRKTRPYPLGEPPKKDPTIFEEISIKVRILNQDLAIITGKWFLNFCEYITKVTTVDVSVPYSSKFYAEEILKLYKEENGITIGE